MTNDDGFTGQRVLITGGTRGMGAATARRFAAEGATVECSPWIHIASTRGLFG